MAESGLQRTAEAVSFLANTQPISDVIPELEIILGAQPLPGEVEPDEAQNRFNPAFIRFVSVFCSREHPLVLFLDDLQWADSASLTMLQSLISSGETAFLLVLGAYRDNEGRPTDPLRLTLDDLRESGEQIRSIRLGPLARAHVIEL